MEINTSKYPIPSITTFIWVGFVCSISFMEAWLKFRAANVTLPIGLSIGREVFGALNRVEWAFAIILMTYLAFNKSKMAFLQLIYFYIPLVLLIVQTLFTLPALNARVDLVLLGHEMQPSFLHFYYLSMELIKVICLFISGIIAFRFNEQKKT